MIVRLEKELQKLQEGGKRLAFALDEVARAIVSGVRTIELNDIAERIIREGGDVPAFLNYRPNGASAPYPATLCVSVNDEVVHGIPSEKGILKEGDIVGVGKGAQNGILIKDAATLETLHKAGVIVVDKTGTITNGKPELSKIENKSDKTNDEILSILATLESRSEHPIAHAIVTYAKEKNIVLKNIEQFENIRGKGLQGIVANQKYFAGNTKILVDFNISFDAKHIDEETRQVRV